MLEVPGLCKTIPFAFPPATTGPLTSVVAAELSAILAVVPLTRTSVGVMPIEGVVAAVAPFLTLRNRILLLLAKVMALLLCVYIPDAVLYALAAFA